VPKSSKDPAADREAELRQTLAMLEAQLSESNRANRELGSQLTEALKGNTELQKQMKELQKKLDVLLAQLKKRNNREYGRKTEKYNPRPAFKPPAQSTEPRKPAKPKARNHEKHIMDSGLPIEQVHHHVDASQICCPTCFVETLKVADKVSYQLERITRTLKKLEHLQEVRSCPKCKQYIVTAQKPTPPIPGSYVAPRLLAFTCVGKLAYGLPLYRQAKMLKHEATIPRSTQSDWMLAAGRLVAPLQTLLIREIKKSKCIRTDDSEIKIQDRTRNGTLRTGKMTVYIGDPDHPYVLFDFSPDQSFARNRLFFEDYSGFVQADGAGGFDALFRDGTKTRVGCNAHSRRNYYEYLLLDSDNLDCVNILDIYNQLYKIEDSIRAHCAEVRLAVRRKKSKPLVKKLHSAISRLRGTLPPTNGLMQAVEYTLGHWTALTRFLKDPNLDIDNNACERAIKSFVLCRKNFLFAGSDEGGRAVATLLSLIATCDILKIDPIEYLTDVFSRINDMKTNELAVLLPDRWAEIRKQSKVS
jgi:transposase